MKDEYSEEELELLRLFKKKKIGKSIKNVSYNTNYKKLEVNCNNCGISSKVKPMIVSIFVSFQDKPEMYCSTECLKAKEFI